MGVMTCWGGDMWGWCHIGVDVGVVTCRAGGMEGW